jgi:cytoskeletal protein RodZ
VRTLEALERGDIAKLPGGIFSRAFVRAYAVEVGLDPEAVVREFISEFPDASVTAGHPSAAPDEDRVAFAADRRMASTLWQVGLLSVPVVVLVLYFGSAGSRLRSSEPVTPAPGAVALAPAQPVEPAAPRVELAEQAPARLRVDLVATAACWVSVTIDGRREFARELQAGERQMLVVSREIVLTAGDAGALVLALNGEDAKALGRSGQVVTVRMTPETYRTFLATP